MRPLLSRRARKLFGAPPTRAIDYFIQRRLCERAAGVLLSKYKNTPPRKFGLRNPLAGINFRRDTNALRIQRWKHNARQAPDSASYTVILLFAISRWI